MDNSKPTQRPELFSAPQAASKDSRRILASLENRGQNSTPADALARVRPGHLVAGLSLLTVLAAALACISYVGMAPAQHRMEFTASKRQTPLVKAPQEAEPMAAAIVNQPLPAIAPAGRKQAPAARAGAAPGNRPAAHARSRSRASAIDSARPRAAAYSSATAPPAPFPAAAQPDSDVALLAALVAHTGGQASAAPVMQASRDVVERRDGDSTDGLRRRCQRLGGAEAGLCRARICSGLWLHERACRTPASD